MAKHHKLELSETERQELIELRDKGEPAYLRERAAVLLKIQEGFSPHKVAKKGLFRQRDPDTVYAWLHRYRADGIQGLYHKPGRGRKPAYAPKSSEEAEAEVYNTIGQGPNRSMPIKCGGRSAHLETSCRGSVMFQCRVFIKSSHAYVSAISVPGHTCGARIQTMPQKSPGFSKF